MLELASQLTQLLQPSICRADRDAFLAVRVRAGLARIQPVLHGSGEQAVRDVPDVSLVVGVRDLVAEIDGLTEGFAERIIGFLHEAAPK